MKNVFFLGNSFTYFNNMPLMVQTLAQNAGLQTNCEKFVRGGAFLHEYAEKDADDRMANVKSMSHALKRIYECQYAGLRWNSVVIQDQSANPALNKEDFLASVDTLLKDVFVNGEELYFYQTWAYKPTSARYTAAPDGQLPPLGLSYEELYLKLKAAYAEAAQRFGGTLVPAGDAFYASNAKYPEVDLYAPDGAHPSPIGTYLIACVFTAKLYGLAPESLSHIDGLDPAETAKMRETAAAVLK